MNIGALNGQAIENNQIIAISTSTKVDKSEKSDSEFSEGWFDELYGNELHLYEYNRQSEENWMDELDEAA